MKVDSEKFKQALSLLSENEKYPSQPLSSRTEEYLKNAAIPIELLDFLKQHSYSDDLLMGAAYFGQVNSIDERNSDDYHESYIDSGYLAVGSGLNGDPVAVELKTGVVGYLSHDELWESAEVEPKAVFCAVASSVGEFYSQATTEEGFPCDFYQAEEQARDV